MPARRTRIAPLAAAVALGATLTLSGCGGDDDSGGLSEVGEQIEQKTEEGANQVEDAGKDAADKAEETTENVGDKAEDAGKDAADKAEETTEDAGDHTEHETSQ